MAAEDIHERRPVSEADAAAYRARREALHAAASDLEHELDALATQSRADSERFHAAVARTRERLEQHIAEADAPGGLLLQILETAAWFSSRANQLRAEHGELLDRASDLLERAERAQDVTPLLPDARRLAERIADHRHRGTTLLLDAYMLDLAPGD